MITVLSLMTLGIIIGWFLHSKENFLKFTNTLTNWAIYALLFLLGLSVGTNDKILNNFDKIGLQAILLTIFAVVGSILLAWLTYHLFLKIMKGSLIILSFFIAGILAGIYELLPLHLLENDYSLYALYLLMFLVGIGIGSNKNALNLIKEVNFKIVLVPLSIIMGTYIGVSVFYLMQSSLSFTELLAIGSGFGYYSLSSVLLSKIAGDTIGVIALLSNITREIITLLVTPVFARYFGRLSPIASGGATAMDTTLPVITKYIGSDYAIISVFSGVVLTILVPVLIEFIYFLSRL